MKKTLALVLALAMVFSTITVAFAEGTLGEDAQICADLGMLKGETGTVDAAYVATAPTRLQAAVMFLRLKGLEAEALAFTGEENFADGNIAWAEGANLLAYLKANPQLGWIGDGVSFNPTGVMTAQAYYKVLLEALGYKQTTAEVAGDFAWEEVLTFAASVGLSKVADVENFTVNDLAVATVEALKVDVKGTEKTLAATLVEAGVVDEAKAVAAELVEAAPAVTAVEVKEAKATGNAVVEVTFKEAVDEAAANVANYSIEGLEVNSAAISGEKTVILGTGAMVKGKLYKLTVGGKTIQFTGVGKVSGGPEITEVVSEDVEEVVITFDKNIDLATGTDAANYTIAGVTVVSAEVDEDEVTLTTDGLKNKTNYTVKVTNIKSTDLVSRKATSKSFKTNYDTAAPRIDSDKTKFETNQRVVLYFNEEVSKETAEDLANYSMKVNETDGEELEIISVTWDDDDEDNVEIVTEPMEKGVSYKLSVNNIADQRKVPNVMTRPSTFTAKGLKEDKSAPTVDSAVAISQTKIIVTFNDDSKIDEASALDINNYTLTYNKDNYDIEDAETLTNKNGLLRVLLTVQELETGKNHTLKIVDILDEFGNAMKEKSETVDADADNFASVQLVQVEFVDEDEIILFFDGELDEDSAENIANYSINNDIGNPTKATYEDDDYDYDRDEDIDGNDFSYRVVLKVNDLINGKKYKITVDGVTDLAGNELSFTTKKLEAKAVDENPLGQWDEEAPELENADAVNKYIAALEFDEEVKATGAKLGLNYTDELGAQTKVLDFKALSEDNTVVEFSDYDTFELEDGVTYTVYAVTGITDLIGNPFVFVYDADDKVTFSGDKGDVEAAEMESYEQINGGEFEVTMSKDVRFIAGGSTANVTAKVGDDDVAFVAKIEDGLANVVKLELVGGLTKGVEYVFELDTFLEDEHDVPAANDEVDEDAHIDRTVFEADETDKTKPYIVDVVAVDRMTIEVEFSEDIKVADGFTIKNIDKDKTVTIDDCEIDGAIVTINLNDALEGRYEYELKLAKGEVEDFAANAADADSITFDGIDLAPLPDNLIP